MVTVVVMAILAAIGLPIYQNYTYAARRAEGQQAMVDAASRQEQFSLDSKTYTTIVGAGGLNLNATTQGGYYQLSVQAATLACAITSCYVVVGVPQGTQANDSCGTLTLSSEGDRLPAGCW